MTLYKFGPMVYSEFLKVSASVNKRVRKIFVFYTAQENRYEDVDYKMCQNALSVIENYLNESSFIHDYAFIKVWYEEKDLTTYEDLSKVVLRPSSLPIFTIWTSNHKIQGADCTNPVRLNSYLTNEGVQWKKTGTESKKTMIANFEANSGDIGSVFTWK